MSTTLYLVRHGQTKLNKLDVFRGLIDVELDEEGIKQSISIAERLKTFNVDAVVSSPLKRSIQTAEPIAGYHNLTVEIGRNFIDMNLGIWQNMPKAQVKQKYPELWNLWLTEPVDLIIPEGEKLIDVKNRVQKGINNLIEKFKDKNIVLVTHRIILKVIMAVVLNLERNYYWKFRFDNCGLSCIRFTNSDVEITCLNDTSHL